MLFCFKALNCSFELWRVIMYPNTKENKLELKKKMFYDKETTVSTQMSDFQLTFYFFD